MKKLFCLSLLQNYTRILLYTHNQKAIGAMLTLLWRTIDNPPRDTKLTVSAMSLIWLMVLSISWKGKTLVQSTLETEERSQSSHRPFNMLEKQAENPAVCYLPLE
ncbi:uncharacterized protein LOC129320224 isoform X2 [Prosopis cineraria]|uniref:uncharacterized protein LOC129320224 isoform X2 n=1 Tax=Prosopis cineraria TaxID=364024 RepID=UPI00241023D1|nr:uncharacterized protein LOC129320224 isoform X2 [Prosopis cineraria]